MTGIRSPPFLFLGRGRAGGRGGGAGNYTATPLYTPPNHPHLSLFPTPPIFISLSPSLIDAQSLYPIFRRFPVRLRNHTGTLGALN